MLARGAIWREPPVARSRADAWGWGRLLDADRLSGLQLGPKL